MSRTRIGRARSGPLLAALGVLALLLGACAQPGPATGAPAATSSGSGAPGASNAPAAPSGASAPAAAAPRREKVKAAYATPSGAFAGIWMAKEAGLFDKYGLDVELVYISSSPTMLQSMVAGEIQFGELAASGASANVTLEGGDVVWITEAMNRPILYVIARPEIRGMDDLRGKTIGVTRVGTTTHTFMKAALRASGLDPERDVQILQTGGSPETIAALASGGIVAGVSGPPLHLNALDAGMHILLDLAELGMAWPFGGTVTTRGYIAAHPDAVQSYVKAYTEALHLLRTDRERAVAVITKYAELADRSVAERTWEIYRDRYAIPPTPDPVAMMTVVEEEVVPTNPKARDVPPTTFYDDRFTRELETSGFLRQLGGQ